MMDVSIIVHVAGGLIGLVSGTFAIISRKGGGPHKQVGWVFVASMIVMAVPGGIISYLASKPFDVLSCVLSSYMVLSGWYTVKTPKIGYDIVLATIGTLCLCGYVAVEIYALIGGIRATDAPSGAGYVFATILLVALIGDVDRLVRGYNRQRTILRHLWRMCFGLFVASGSFFGARPHLFPEWMQSFGILMMLTFAPLLVMAYWQFKLRRHKLAVSK